MGSRTSGGWNEIVNAFAKRGAQRSGRRSYKRHRSFRFECCENRNLLAVFTVNSMLDNGDGANITLREAVIAANESLDVLDTLKFDETVFGSGGTILLTQGQINIPTGNIIIDGRDSAGVPLGITIDAGDGTDQTPNTGDGFRIFNLVFSSGTLDVEINSLTLTGGDPSGAGGAISSQLADLTIKNSVITGNAALTSGGGIYAAHGDVTIESSEVSENSSGINGGGIRFRSVFEDELNVISSTISGNSGGGIWSYGGYVSVDIQSSLITGNQSPSNTGGGIYFGGRDLTVQSTTIRNNATHFDGAIGVVAGGGGLFANALIPGGFITIDQSTIEENQTTGFNSFGAGAFLIANNASMTITGTTISNNQGLGDEVNVGGLAVQADNSSSVLIDGADIIGNHADDDVGGLYIGNTSSTVTVRNTTISANTAHQNAAQSQNAAGGVWAVASSGAQTTIESSTISDNAILTPLGGTKYNAYGGGVFIQGATGTTTILRNSTISGNQAEGSGAGIKIAEYPSPQGGQVSVFHCTITNNRADTDNDGIGTGGGIHVGNSTTIVTIAHTIIAGNFRGSGTTRSDIVGPLAGTWSLIGDNTGANISGSNNQIGTGANPVDPFLLPLADNGGPTMTHALQAFSPARDMGDPLAAAGVNGVSEFDQRGTGFSRKVGSRIDIGAYEMDMICIDVSTTADEIDGDLSYGDLSLREAINYANAASEHIRICLPEGEYYLSLSGTGSVSQGDLDATGNMTIVGDGAGLSVINGGSMSGRVFDVANGGILGLSRLTLAVGHGTSNSDERSGGAIRVQGGAQLHMDNSAVVGNETGGWGLGGGIYFAGSASGSIETSVITSNYADQETGGLYLKAASSGTGGTVTLKATIIANNWDGEGTSNPDIFVGANRTLNSLGNNRFTSASGFTQHATDHMGQVDYVVTSVADTYDGSYSPLNMSLRDAVHQANITAGAQVIWLPAWDFVLTRERLASDASNVAYGDLEILDSVEIYGIDGLTTISWDPTAASDRIFELIGDYNFDGAVDNADDISWSIFDGQTGSNLPADGDDDGDVDDDDRELIDVYFNESLELSDVLLL